MGKNNKRKSNAARMNVVANGTQDSELNAYLLEEAMKVREMIKSMAKRVEVGQEWHVVSMQWISKWQVYTGFDTLDSPDSKPSESEPKPPRIDNANIIDYLDTSGFDPKPECQLMEVQVSEKWQNYQLKPNLKEGEDFMLVDASIYKFWADHYGEPEFPLKRYGVENESGETVVELYLQKLNIIPIPN
jgi:hypothetical protein